MAPGLSALGALYWLPFADGSAPTILYWAQISPYVPSVFPFGLVTLFLVAVVALGTIANILYARAVRGGDVRGGGVGATVLFLGPLLGSSLGVLLCSVVAVMLIFLEDMTGVPASAFALACAIGSAVLLILAVTRQARHREQIGLPLRLRVASVVGAVLLTLGVLALFVVLAFSNLQSSFAHLASASYAGQRYHLAQEDHFLERPTLHLYRCDALGVLCQEVDSVGYGATEHGGLLQVDEYAGIVTVRAEDGHLLFIYPLKGAFAA